MAKGKQIKIKKSQLYLGLAVLVVVVVGIFIYMNWDNLKPDTKVAEVNGKVIKQSEIDRVKQAFGQQTGNEINDSQALEQLIGRTLLIQEAEKRNITISDEDVEAFLTQQAAQYGLDLNGFKAQIQNSGANYDELFEAYRDQMQMQELVKQITEEENVEVTEVEVREFYDENQEIFTQGGNETSYENVKDQIEFILMQQKQSEVIAEFIEELKTEAEVTYY